MVRRIRVLVVDDSSLNREITKEVLGDEYTVLEANDGQSALIIAERYHPRIVLLDIMLPDMDGYEVCRKLRAIPSIGDARIVMLTAKAMPSERARGFEAGADAYISKPFDDDELIEALRPARWNRGIPQGECIRRWRIEEDNVMEPTSK